MKALGGNYNILIFRPGGQAGELYGFPWIACAQEGADAFYSALFKFFTAADMGMGIT